MNKYFEKIIKEYGFEKRDGQQEMAHIIEKSLEANEHCIIEAGTGIGKTLAYLLPAIIYAKKNKKRVVVSTNTINLQEQLIEKDLPFLEKVMGEKIKYRLVKGRSNYVCGNRLMRNCKDDSLIDWYKKTKTGDKSEIDFYIDPTSWELVKSDKDYCINSKCRQTKNCFYYKSRESINDSEILIVNHALLFTHFKYDKVLPEFDILIFDEAHNIESVARNYFEESLSSKELGTNIGMIYNSKTNSGVFRRFSNINDIYIDFVAAINSLYSAFNTLFTTIRLDLIKYNTNSIRLDKIKDFSKYEQNIEEIIKKFKDFEMMNRIFLEKELEDDLKQEYIMYYSKIKQSIDFITTLFCEKTQKTVDWFEFCNNTQELRIVKTPLDVSKFLKEIYKNLKVIMTSATLRIGTDFSYISNRLGLENFTKHFVNSPFDYNKNMKIILPNNNYNPNSIEYINYVIEFLNKYINEKNEGTFVLCTSYKQVTMISNGLKLKNFNVLVQGQMSRSKMINEFKNSKSVLLGTDSFWEGVDVKGDSLKNIIIVKLPFLVPDNPVTEAIIEDIKIQGGNPFMSYQLPQAVIKLKQGVGRLIRSKTDSGQIVILDNRIKTKYYGKIILNSLPSKSVT